MPTMGTDSFGRQGRPRIGSRGPHRGRERRPDHDHNYQPSHAEEHTGLHRAYPVERALQQTPHSNRTEQSQRDARDPEPGSVRQHQSQHTAAVGAEGHAEPKLGTALFDQERDHAVHADGH
jgi:hypothetical protein